MVQMIINFFGVSLNVIILCAITFIVSVYFGIKNEVTFKLHQKLDRAIYDYKIECIYNRTKFVVDHSDMESYYRTLHRFWDWGYTRILPKEKFEIIKAYI